MLRSWYDFIPESAQTSLIQSWVRTDENRQLVLDAGIPELIMETIHTTTRWRGEQPDEGQERKRRLLRVEELKLLRAAVGATMNSSLKFGAFSLSHLRMQRNLALIRIDTVIAQIR